MNSRKGMVSTVLMIALLIVGLVLLFTGYRMWAAVPLIGCLLVWAVAPSAIGKAPRRAADAPEHSPEDIRRYREEHPGASISDAIRDLDESSRRR